MSQLTELLKFSYAGNSEKKRMLNTESFKCTVLDNLTGDEKNLLLSENDDYATLLQTEVIGTIVAGANQRRVIRDILPIYQVNSYKARVPFGSSPNSYATEVEDGGAIPTLDGAYYSGNKEIKKFAVRPNITNEIIEDDDYHIIESQLMRAGAAIENALNREAISEMLSGHGGTPTDIDPAGAHIKYEEIANARRAVVDRSWKPDTFIAHPKAIEYFAVSSSTMYDLAIDGSDVIFGMKLHELQDATYTTTTQKWDTTDAANHYYGLALDSKNYACILMRDDIHTTNFNDPVSDITELVVKMRCAVKVVNEDAAARILTK